MADVRAMLRQQRAARQQAQKPQKPSAAPAAAPASKKRKASDDSGEERKRTRTEAEPSLPADGEGATTEQEGATTEREATATAREGATTEQEATATAQEGTTATADASPLDPVTAAELDAFLDEMQDEPPKPASAYASAAVVEAKPMTVAEIAAQAREDQIALRARRNEETEAEQEDAARALEDEFDTMDGLEERVKRLREQREALRSKQSSVPGSVQEDAPDAPVVAPARSPAEEEEEEEEGSGSEDEDWDDWRFRPA